MWPDKRVPLVEEFLKKLSSPNYQENLNYWYENITSATISSNDECNTLLHHSSNSHELSETYQGAYVTDNYYISPDEQSITLGILFKRYDKTTSTWGHSEWYKFTITGFTTPNTITNPSISLSNPGVKAIDSDLINPERNLQVRIAIANSIAPLGSLKPEDITIDTVLASNIAAGTATVSVTINGWLHPDGTVQNNYSTTFSLQGLEGPTSTVAEIKEITVTGVAPTVTDIQSSTQVKTKIKGLVTNEPVDPVGFDVYTVIVSESDIDPFIGKATNVSAVFNKWWPDEKSHTVHGISIHGLVRTNSSLKPLPSEPVTTITGVNQLTVEEFRKTFDAQTDIIMSIQDFIIQGGYVTNVKNPGPEMFEISNPQFVSDSLTQIAVDVAIKAGHFYENGMTTKKPLGTLIIEGFKKQPSQWKNARNYWNLF